MNGEKLTGETNLPRKHPMKQQKINLDKEQLSCETCKGTVEVSMADAKRRPRTRSTSDLRSNLLRDVKGRDPYEVYDLVEEVGKGSISTISKIRKKDSAVGGSARKNLVQTEKKRSGFLSRFRIRRRKKSDREDASSSSRSNKKEMVFALKNINLGLVNDEYIAELQNEVEILKSLDHPNIVKAYETYEHKKHLYIVMELCTGGNLYTRHPYTERQAASIVRKILSSVAYLHKNNIIHRDLKFENVMFEDSRPNAEIKLIDFGLSKKYLSPDHVMSDRVGTIYSMAPEVIHQVYTSKADIWSVGVMTYMLLSGTKPFWGSTKKRVIDKIKAGLYRLDRPGWELISKSGKKFVRSLLQVNSEKRLSAEEALKSDWFTNESDLSDKTPDVNVMDKVHESIVRYTDNGEFKKLVLNVIAYRSSTDEILQLREAFNEYDKAKDGCIHYSEFKEALAKFNYTEKELEEMFRSVNVNDDDGIIFYTEFLAATLEAHGRIEEERLAEAFDRIDSDDTGFISKENLLDIIGQKCIGDGAACKDQWVKQVIAEVDVDGDGKISYDEFLSAFHNKNKERIQFVCESDVRRTDSSDED